MNEFFTDIVIIGGGVAGYSLAYALRQSFSILIVDNPYTKQEYADCMLYPQTLSILDSWGLLKTLRNTDALEFHKITLRKNITPLVSLDLSSMNKIYPFGLSIDHETLRTFLKEQCIHENISCLDGATVHTLHEQEKGYMKAEVIIDGLPVTVHTKFVICVDGAMHLFKEHMPTHTQATGLDTISYMMPLQDKFREGKGIYLSDTITLSMQKISTTMAAIDLYIHHDKRKEWLILSNEEKYAALCAITTDMKHIQPEFLHETITQIHTMYPTHITYKNSLILGSKAYVPHPLAAKATSMAIADADMLSRILDGSLQGLSRKLDLFELKQLPQIRKEIRKAEFFSHIAINTDLHSQNLLHILPTLARNPVIQFLIDHTQYRLEAAAL